MFPEEDEAEDDLESPEGAFSLRLWEAAAVRPPLEEAEEDEEVMSRQTLLEGSLER